MKTDEHTQHPDIQRGHETRDAHFKSVVISGIGLLGLMALGLLISFGLMAFLKGTTAQPGSHPETFVEPQTNALPPAPRLQADPHANLLALRASEDSILTSYGRSSDDSTAVRIPIDRAMELLVKKGLPTQSVQR